MIKLKRVYEGKEEQDGLRILVERLWPRGITKEKAAVDLWLKELAPSTELRKWFSHDPEKWREFRRRYAAELEERKEALALVRGKSKKGTVTFLYSSHDQEHNNAVALKELLEKS